MFCHWKLNTKTKTTDTLRSWWPPLESTNLLLAPLRSRVSKSTSTCCAHRGTVTTGSLATCSRMGPTQIRRRMMMAGLPWCSPALEITRWSLESCSRMGPTRSSPRSTYQPRSRTLGTVHSPPLTSTYQPRSRTIRTYHEVPEDLVILSRRVNCFFYIHSLINADNKNWSGLKGPWCMKLCTDCRRFEHPFTDSGCYDIGGICDSPGYCRNLTTFPPVGSSAPTRVVDELLPYPPGGSTKNIG